ncbi:hypothetical protein MROS_0678 [Melioribacter roseus P3M-2]|uniref:DUF2721 domain-containing protein n=1 Tax=Melioribacter roseus (strain DSM 23840 / JCM 17771 / VKM B-2668 / P3M-2) TaxID=1191523 RepID=I7A1Y9_MELRP|nr:DUF2721 domain-containing protein [Melioribacter roseus]AFN73921.1 hypothetical protein MROS_0678 [Melioribacter roseus P3M-2]
MQNKFLFDINAQNLIQLMLAPAVMISACGLLLLGINNRYSLVVNRIRLLNEEKRRLFVKVGDKPLSTTENLRLESIARQIELLVYRVRLIRNSALSYVAAVALFVLTSLLLGFGYLLSIDYLNFPIVIAFLLGMILVLTGALFCGL